MRVWPGRRQYGDVLGERVRRADVRGLFDLGIRWVGSALSRRAGRPLIGPALGTLLVTYRCNLRCRVCDLPARAAARRRAGDRELDTHGFRRVLRDMRQIGTAGVGVTGGEPMLREDVEELLAYATRLGLHAHVNTDGFRVVSSARALVATGLRSVNISLDGATAAQHDLARGRVGAYEDARRAIEALRRARGRAHHPRITAVTVLTSTNIRDVGRVAEAAFEAGADRLGVIPVHDFGQGEREVAAEDLTYGLQELRRLAAGGRLDNSPAYLDLVPTALAGRKSPLVCYAPHTSVVVDCYGDVYPCFPLMERHRPVGTIPLVRLWRGMEYAKAREDLAGCRDCLWNCHTEMNLVLPQGRGRTRRPA